MKRDRCHVVLVAVVALAGAAIFGCAHAQRRSDWRMQSGVCTSDADCNGGKCAIELGASEGRCSGGNLPALPPGGSSDGGARPPGPPPSIQPSPGDIQI